mmetsp:Transcript_62191/g.74836  ORF Transcript_62191/g.74836 Transcript_62191/m.74836 type:complete len:200 (+) Transcript_62191:626-1225(+)
MHPPRCPGSTMLRLPILSTFGHTRPPVHHLGPHPHPLLRVRRGTLPVSPGPRTLGRVPALSRPALPAPGHPRHVPPAPHQIPALGGHLPPQITHGGELGDSPPSAAIDRRDSGSAGAADPDVHPDLDTWGASGWDRKRIAHQRVGNQRVAGGSNARYQTPAAAEPPVAVLWRGTAFAANPGTECDLGLDHGGHIAGWGR